MRRGMIGHCSLLGAVAEQVLPRLLKKDPRCWWILDDTAHAKNGIHSVGVARQYSGRLGKTDNCQVAVSLSLAYAHGSLPLDYRLYLPKEWTDDPKRCKRAGVPAEIQLLIKGQIVRAAIEAALAAGIALGVGTLAGAALWLSQPASSADDTPPARERESAEAAPPPSARS